MKFSIPRNPLWYPELRLDDSDMESERNRGRMEVGHDGNGTRKWKEGREEWEGREGVICRPPSDIEDPPRPTDKVFALLSLYLFIDELATFVPPVTKNFPTSRGLASSCSC